MVNRFSAYDFYSLSVVGLAVVGLFWALDGVTVWAFTHGEDIAMTFSRLLGVMALPGAALCGGAAIVVRKRMRHANLAALVACFVVVILGGISGGSVLGNAVTHMLAFLVCVLSIVTLLMVLLATPAKSSRAAGPVQTDNR